MIGAKEKQMNDLSIEKLREAVRCRMNGKRYEHTLGVERMAAALGELYLPERVDELRCAALLHDITKNETVEKQLQYCAEFDIMVEASVLGSPKLFHARTAAALIPRDFPEYATEDIVSAVRYHTTGRDGMSLFEALIYLADYIDDTRTFDDCVRLRSFFWDASPEKLGEEDRLIHLYRTMVLSLDMTVRSLIADASYIDADTVACRNYYLGYLK